MRCNRPEPIGMFCSFWCFSLDLIEPLSISLIFFSFPLVLFLNGVLRCWSVDWGSLSCKFVWWDLKSFVNDRFIWNLGCLEDEIVLPLPPGVFSLSLSLPDLIRISFLSFSWRVPDLPLFYPKIEPVEGVHGLNWWFLGSMIFDLFISWRFQISPYFSKLIQFEPVTIFLIRVANSLFCFEWKSQNKIETDEPFRFRTGMNKDRPDLIRVSDTVWVSSCHFLQAENLRDKRQRGGKGKKKEIEKKFFKEKTKLTV